MKPAGLAPPARTHKGDNHTQCLSRETTLAQFEVLQLNVCRINNLHALCMEVCRMKQCFSFMAIRMGCSKAATIFEGCILVLSKPKCLGILNGGSDVPYGATGIPAIQRRLGPASSCACGTGTLPLRPYAASVPPQHPAPSQLSC